MSDVAPTIAHFVSLSAPQGGRVSPWGGPASKPVAPTIAHFVSLSGLAGRRAAEVSPSSGCPRLRRQARSRSLQPQGGRVSLPGLTAKRLRTPWGGPAAKPLFRIECF